MVRRLSLLLLLPAACGGLEASEDGLADTEDAVSTVLAHTTVVGPIALGAPIDARLHRNKNDGYTLEGKKGLALDLALDARGSADPVLYLYGPKSGRSWGPKLARNDDAVGLDSRISFVLPADGTYLVVAADYYHRAVSYELRASGPMMPPPPSIELPPNMSWCPAGSTCDSNSISAIVCPDTSPGCQPRRSTTVRWSVNGAPVSAMATLVRAAGETGVVVTSPDARVYSNFVIASFAPAMRLFSDADITLSYYGITPVWGGTTALDFTATGQTGSHGSSYFYRHPSWDPGVTHAEISDHFEREATDLIALSGVTPPAYRAFLMPVDVALVPGGEGNLAFTDGTLAINYGNPEWTPTQGGVLAVAVHEFSHEFTHTIFGQIQGQFGGGNTVCLNEGLADALGNFAGFVPDSDFGQAQDGSDFSKGCLASTEIHAIGNCVLWNAKQAGLFSTAMMNGLFHPQHVLQFDSCTLGSTQTGNAYTVYLTEASGQDASAFLTAIGVPNAGSYDAAKAALGL